MVCVLFEAQKHLLPQFEGKSLKRHKKMLIPTPCCSLLKYFYNLPYENTLAILWDIARAGSIGVSTGLVLGGMIIFL